MRNKNHFMLEQGPRVSILMLFSVFIALVLLVLTAPVFAATIEEEVKNREEKTMDLLSKIDAFTEQDENLRLDAARAHYNMGNIYFQKGEYELASREYYQAVTLMPDDPDSHYNLAYVSGEYLSDHETSLKHYNLYLYLNPGAEDTDFVRSRIAHAELALRSIVDSPLEDDQKP